MFNFATNNFSITLWRPEESSFFSLNFESNCTELWVRNIYVCIYKKKSISRVLAGEPRTERYYYSILPANQSAQQTRMNFIYIYIYTHTNENIYIEWKSYTYMYISILLIHIYIDKLYDDAACMCVYVLSIVQVHCTTLDCAAHINVAMHVCSCESRIIDALMSYN